MLCRWFQGLRNGRAKSKVNHEVICRTSSSRGFVGCFSSGFLLLLLVLLFGRCLSHRMTLPSPGAPQGGLALTRGVHGVKLWPDEWGTAEPIRKGEISGAGRGGGQRTVGRSHLQKP